MTPAQFKKMRESMGLNQAELAQELEVSREHIVRIEKGRKIITKTMELALKYLSQESRLNLS